MNADLRALAARQTREAIAAIRVGYRVIDRILAEIRPGEDVAFDDRAGKRRFRLLVAHRAGDDLPGRRCVVEAVPADECVLARAIPHFASAVKGGRKQVGRAGRFGPHDHEEVLPLDGWAVETELHELLAGKSADAEASVRVGLGLWQQANSAPAADE